MSKNKGRTNTEIKAAVVAKLAAGTPVSAIKSTAAGERLGGAAIREIAQNRGYAPAPVVTPPAATTSTSPGGRTTADLKQVIASRAAAGTPLSEIKTSFAGEKLGASTVQNIFQRNRQVPPSSTTGTETSTETTEPTEEVFDLYGAASGAFGITEPELLAAEKGAELRNQSQISNYGWDAQRAIAALQQAGATERTKYEVDNKIPLLQEEARGKIDLQKIVNAGYKNIANIERGTEMVRNITSMFNF